MKSGCGVSAIKFMPENVNTLAVGYDDVKILMLDLRASNAVAELDPSGNVTGSVRSMCFSKSGRLLFSAYDSDQIQVWDVCNEQSVGSIKVDPLTMK